MPLGPAPGTGWEQPQPCACRRGHLPFLFHITSVSFLLRILAEKVAGSATLTDCVAFTGKRCAAEEEELSEQQLSPGRSHSRAVPVPPDQTNLVQPSTHGFLLGCHDMPLCPRQVGTGTPSSLCRDGCSLPLTPPAPTCRHQGLGRCTLPSGQPASPSPAWNSGVSILTAGSPETLLPQTQAASFSRTT